MLLWKIHHTIFTLSHVLCFFIKFLVFKSFSGFNLSFWNAVVKNSPHHIHTFSCALLFHQVPCFQIFLRVQLKLLKCCHEKFTTPYSHFLMCSAFSSSSLFSNLSQGSTSVFEMLSWKIFHTINPSVTLC